VLHPADPKEVFVPRHLKGFHCSFLKLQVHIHHKNMMALKQLHRTVKAPEVNLQEIRERLLSQVPGPTD
jgi:hypothetical protein